MSCLPKIVYLAEQAVTDDLGGLGRIWPEADAEASDLETVITDLLTGQYSSPVRVVALQFAERWSEDVSEDVAQEIRRPHLAPEH